MKIRPAIKQMHTRDLVALQKATARSTDQSDIEFRNEYLAELKNRHIICYRPGTLKKEST